MKNILFAVIISIITISCHTQKETVKTEVTVSSSTADQIELTVDEPRDSTSLLIISIDESNNMKDIGDEYTIESAEIKNNQLWLAVSYGGGCEEHEFKMLFNNAYQERLDEESGQSGLISLTLNHHGNDDRCRSIVRQNIRFDLKPIKNPGYKNLIIRIKEWEEELIYGYND
ncbi:MAG: hypothetical protein ACI9GM_000124 [Salibacteraceae bacterium]|jgi:hypothetical protein